jgi:UDP-N-acetylmuramate--alanine ligase
LGSLAGRRIYFVGIGGAGLSAYAQLALAWGAEVRGWDRVETPYLRNLTGIDVDIAEEPSPPDGWQVVVSTAYGDRVAGTSRAEFLAELTSERRTIVVGGAHGKGTTSAMIAFVLDRLALDPAFAIGADVPQLGSNARAGAGWFVVEGDESDRTVFGLHADIAVVTNLDLDHHTEFASLAELEHEFDVWLARAGTVVRGDVLDPYQDGFALMGAHNRQNAATALAALDAAGVAREDSEAALAEFRGVKRRLERHGEPGGVAVYDDYGHHPTEIAAAIDALREGHERVLVLFQPHLYSRTRYLAREFAVALARADVACVADVYPAREQPIDGVTGKLVVEALAEVRPGMPVVWTPQVEDGVPALAARARPGDAVLTVGAGDVDRAAPLLLEALA